MSLVKKRSVGLLAYSLKRQLDTQGAPKRPDTFENLIEIKRVDENN